MRLLIFMCLQKKLTRGPEQYVSLIVAGAAFSNTLVPVPWPKWQRDVRSRCQRWWTSRQSDVPQPDQIVDGMRSSLVNLMLNRTINRQSATRKKSSVWRWQNVQHELLLKAESSLIVIYRFLSLTAFSNRGSSVYFQLSHVRVHPLRTATISWPHKCQLEWVKQSQDEKWISLNCAATNTKKWIRRQARTVEELQMWIWSLPAIPTETLPWHCKMKSMGTTTSNLQPNNLMFLSFHRMTTSTVMQVPVIRNCQLSTTVSQQRRHLQTGAWSVVLVIYQPLHVNAVGRTFNGFMLPLFYSWIVNLFLKMQFSSHRVMPHWPYAQLRYLCFFALRFLPTLRCFFTLYHFMLFTRYTFYVLRFLPTPIWTQGVIHTGKQCTKLERMYNVLSTPSTMPSCHWDKSKEASHSG